MTAKILVVEDNSTQAKILGLLLKDHFEVTTARSGEDCLEKLAQASFDVVLLDVNLPGMNGYEVCRHIKADFETEHIPVIFVSVNCTHEDRLHGFDAGGFDYLAKPVVKEELLKKISILMEHQEEKLRLKSTVEFATNTAMTAMTSAAEQGLLLQFMKSCFRCKNQKDLAMAILHTVKQFGLEGVVQIRGEYALVSRGQDGPCTPLEEAVLANVSGAGRIVTLRQRTAINYPHSTLIVKNMPTDDPERYGRLKDHLSMLMEGADARVGPLDMDCYLAAEAKRLLALVQGISGNLMDVSDKSQQLHKGYGDVFNKMMHGLEAAIPQLELNFEQENQLNSLLDDASKSYVSLADQENQVKKQLQVVADSLKEIVPQSTASSTPTFASKGWNASTH